MSQNGYSVIKLFNHIEAHGIRGLLPQNLTQELLDRLNMEGNAIEKDKTATAVITSFVTAVKHLEKGDVLSKSKNVETDICNERLLECVYMYMASLRLESLRREKKIVLKEKDLPTLKNIFDMNRSIDIHQL